MKPKISVIVRTRNESKWLPHLLSALKLQTNQNFEVVLIDNCSSDNSVEVAKRFGVKKIDYIEEFRPGLALNMGVALSDGDFAVFVSAHCIPATENWLDELTKSIDVSNDVFAAYGRQLPLPVTGDLDRRDLLNTFGLDPIIQQKDFFFHNANSVVHREYIENYPFDKSVTNVEDRLWAKELIDRGHKIAYNPSASVYHYHGLNHKNDLKRMQAVTTLISPLYETAPNVNSELIKIDTKILAIILSNEEVAIPSEILESLVSSVLNCGVPIEIIAVSNHYTPVKNARRMSRDEFSQIDSMSLFEALRIILLAVEAQTGEIYDHVLFLNPQYTKIAQSLLNKLLDKHLCEFLDLTFFARESYLNIWHLEGINLLPLSSDALNAPRSNPRYIAYYGLGTLATRSSLLMGEKVPEYVGIIELTPDIDTSRIHL